MGNSHSQNQKRHRPSSEVKGLNVEQINKKINDNEYTFIAMQGEIDRAISENNKSNMKTLSAEISARIIDLNQLRNLEISSTDRGRIQRVIYNFELSLAKLKSVFNYNTDMKRKTEKQLQNSLFYCDPVEPDIVSDLIRFDRTEDTSERRPSYRDHRTTLPTVSENIAAHIPGELLRSNSLYDKSQTQNLEDTFSSVSNEFHKIKIQAEKSVNDVSEYYQMDKDIFYLYVKLKNVDVSDDLKLNQWKFRLLNELVEFRTALDKKSGELEEQKDVDQEINTLELLFDSTLKNEMENLKVRALTLQLRVERSNWEPSSTGRKIEFLRRLAEFLEKIAYAANPASSCRNSVEHVYGSVSLLPEETDHSKSKGGDESIYTNVEIIRRNDDFVSKNGGVIPRVGPKEYNISLQRGTVYMNADVVNQNNDYENNPLKSENVLSKSCEIINKRPLPLPRNYDEKIINDLPKHWRRLNEIFDKNSFTETDKLEIDEIQKHAEVAKNLFQRKIRKLVDKFEESVEL